MTWSALIWPDLTTSWRLPLPFSCRHTRPGRCGVQREFLHGCIETGDSDHGALSGHHRVSLLGHGRSHQQVKFNFYFCGTEQAKYSHFFQLVVKNPICAGGCFVNKLIIYTGILYLTRSVEGCSHFSVLGGVMTIICVLLCVLSVLDCLQQIFVPLIITRRLFPPFWREALDRALHCKVIIDDGYFGIISYSLFK